jgi:hypothetical protein
MKIRKVRSLKILDFDIENRPLSYWMPDRPTAEITAIASCWTDDLESMEVQLLTPWATLEDRQAMLQGFVVRYDEADLVTGHYIRKHDLPIINGALMELNLPLLRSKLTCDTKLDMMKKADIPATQEALLNMLHVRDVYGKTIQKFHMSQEDWREANRLTQDGLQKTHDRVASDVFGHIQLRKAMLRNGMLGAPRVWEPGGGAGNTPGRSAGEH